MDLLESMKQDILQFGTGPTFDEMPRCTLSDKGLDGPTAAHRIEELHTPVNFAYITTTTGTSAFQNIVGVTRQEIAARIESSSNALNLAGIKPGDNILISYPPLVGVFSKQALDSYGVKVSFIPRPSRDALLVALCTERPQAVIGESSFLRAALIDAKKLGLLQYIPKGLILIAAGSPMDPQLPDEVKKLEGAVLHDLYGCQEFGWLCINGIPLRSDITIWDCGRADRRSHLIVGGMATGDCFLTTVGDDGKTRILTETRVRAESEPETWLTATTAADRNTALRTARSILRIKAKVVKVSSELQCKAEATSFTITIPGENCELKLNGPVATRMFDDLMEAQKEYQREAKTDPVWNKRC